MPVTKNKYKLGKVVVSEAIIRPTGLLDPVIEIKPVTNQVDDVLEQVRTRTSKGQRVLITTLTKKFAEELDLYFKEINLKSAYIHSDVETLDRVEILSDLRRGKYDVLIGINLLREGLDLPEVSLIAIFDADKEGFLRSRTSLIQIIGRAARHSEGKVIMYAQSITKSMQAAIDETNRRREIQMEYNHKHNITPTSTHRELENIVDDLEREKENDENYGKSDAMYTPTGFEQLDEIIELGGKKSKKNKFQPQSSGQNTRSGKGEQVYQNFDVLKDEFLEEIKVKQYSKEELKELLNQAVTDMEFEKAAAIRDLLKSGGGK